MGRAPILLAALLACTCAAAATRLDDSLSPRQRVQATTRWVYDGVGDWTADQRNALVADVRAMEFRLRTASYVGKTAEIYLVLSDHVSGLKSPTGMRVDWTTRGRFSPGWATPGTRSLVFRGMITEPVMSDYFDFRVFIDARTWERGIEFDPVFEIELVAP
jgi:hypothetical protein